MSWLIEGSDRDSLPLPHSLPLGASQVQIPQEEVASPPLLPLSHLEHRLL